VASRGRRSPFSTWGGRLPNFDPTLLNYGSRYGIGLYTRLIQQFAFIGGYCAQWIDHVLAIDRVIKPADTGDPKTQKVADQAAVRARKAWARAKNRVIVLQKLLYGRFYGFARAERVWRFDRVVKEWIPDLYDVPQEAWMFDDAGNDFLVTDVAPRGTLVDSNRFLHFQWGSADSKYGAGDLSEVYLALWYIQKIQEFGLQAVEDYSHLIAIVHMPRWYDAPQRQKAIESVKEQYRYYVVVPSDETKLSVELPTMNVTSQGTAGRQEYEVIRFYERWIQIRLLGAPQTQDKASSGNGKLEEMRQGIHDDKRPLGSSALDQCLTEGWLDPYCDVNMADLPMELRPRFESDSADVKLTGPEAAMYLNICRALVAKAITATAAEEGFAALGISRSRAKAIADSIVSERDGLTVEPLTSGSVTSGQPPQQEAA
jgi:hypothetical protein